MSNKSGEAIIIGILVGAIIGSLSLYIISGSKAQELADATGREVHQSEVIRENPGQSVMTVVGPAVAGAGVGWLLDNINGDGNEASRDNVIEVNSDEAVTINISGDERSEVTTTDNSVRSE